MRRLLLLVAGLLVPASLFAQTSSTQIPVQGKIFDAMRMPIAGARVTAAPEGPGAAVTAQTDASGEFELRLERGTYTLRAAFEGFAESSRLVTVTQAASGPLEFVLQIASLRDAVTVSAPGGYIAPVIGTATKTPTALVDVPQSVTVVTRELVKDQLMASVGDVVRYVPGIQAHQGENNRDQVIIRGNSSSADFFVNGVRDDVQYYRDLYNLERIEALKGPNALIFGRGGGGGVVNRVTKEAAFMPLGEVVLQAGAYENKRFTTDLGRPLNGTAAFRLNALYENSGSFRDAVDLKRYGVNPSFTVTPGSRTKLTFGYEFFHDGRVADRGITSFQGRPADVPLSTFYGNPADSHVKANVHLGSALVEHRAGGVLVRNRTLIGGYDRFYQNYVPGAVDAAKTQVTLTAYNNATERLNLFNQTDLTHAMTTGAVHHTLLGGAEFGSQASDNFRKSGFFGNSTLSILVPYANPRTTTPVAYRQNATDADNHVETRVAAAFVQDQAEIGRHVQVIGGVRFDHFNVDYHNNRNGESLDRPDNLVSPRAGLVVKPAAAMSIYSSYSVSYLPSSGDQFSSLTTITEQLEPEKFTNVEGGFKWDVNRGLALTATVYRLDRTNTRSTDPNDPARIVQTGSQRTNGVELGASGRVTPAWSVAGGYAWQDAFVTSATATAPVGRQAGQVPHHTLSLWNQYQVHRRVGAGLGVIHRSDMFASIDNTVVLPGYTRADAAAFFSLSRELRLQFNVENLFDATYYNNADSNTNITPGVPRSLRMALTAAF